MKTFLWNIQSWFVGWVTALLTFAIWGGIYAELSNVWTNPDTLKAVNWSQLSSENWNSILQNENTLSGALNEKVSNISSWGIPDYSKASDNVSLPTTPIQNMADWWRLRYNTFVMPYDGIVSVTLSLNATDITSPSSLTLVVNDFIVSDTWERWPARMVQSVFAKKGDTIWIHAYLYGTTSITSISYRTAPLIKTN